MAKRKAVAASSEEDEHYNEQERASGSESPQRPIQSARRSGKKAKKQADSDDESSEEEQLKSAKKSKATKPASVKKPNYGSPSKAEKDSSSVKVGVNEAGEKYIDLGKKRRATVRQFKGATFLDIREFYGDDNDLKPGKKGISLAKEQWEALKNNSDIIDTFFAKLGK